MGLLRHEESRDICHAGVTSNARERCINILSTYLIIYLYIFYSFVYLFIYLFIYPLCMY